jgi:hypothetical protein
MEAFFFEKEKIIVNLKTENKKLELENFKLKKEVCFISEFSLTYS